MRESNMFDFKMFDSEHRAWLSEGRERESKRGSSGNVEGRGGWHLPREWPARGVSADKPSQSSAVFRLQASAVSAADSPEPGHEGGSS